MTAPALAPRAPLDPRTIRGPSYAFPGDPDAQKADYLAKLLRDTEAEAVARYKIATRNLLFADGRQHIDWNIEQRAWRDAPQEPGAVLTVANYIRPILRSRLARLLSAEMRWRATPRSNADDDRDQAAVAENLLTARWESLEMDNELRYGLWMAFSCGVSFLKSFWNPDIGTMQTAHLMLPGPDGAPMQVPVDREGNPMIGEDGEPAPLDQGFRYRQGDTDSCVRTIFNVRTNPDCYGLTQGEGFRWLIDSEIAARSVVQERYKIELTTAVRGDQRQHGLWERLVRSVGHVFGPTADRGIRSDQPADPDSVLLCEYWEPPSELMPKGRLLVVAGGQVLHDGELPQGIVPYVPVYDERRPFDAWGRGSVGDLVPPQQVVNRMLSLILQELRAEGTGQWIGYDLPGVFDQLTNEANAHIRVPATTKAMQLGLSNIATRMPKANINPAWLTMLEESKRQLFDIGAYHEIQRGQVPPGVDSGVAVEHLMEAENAQLDDTVRTLKQSLVTWGRHQLTLARAHYGLDEQRWLRVHREDLDYLVEGVRGADLPDPEQVDINLDGFQPASRAAFRADIKDLMDKQQIPPVQGLKLLDLGRGVAGAYESQTRHYAKARTENLAFERGEVQVIEPPDGGLPIFMNLDGSPMLLTRDDDHALHVERHQELSLDTSKPWPLRQMVLAHIEAHRQAQQTVMLEATMQAAAMQPPPSNGTAPKEASRAN